MTSPLIVVMGVSGSGKSVVGAALSQRLRIPFADADDFHPQKNIDKMHSGHPLDDSDRYPWLETIGEWLVDRDATGGVMGCSALKRKYRDQLRRHNHRVLFLHLAGTRDTIAARQAARPGHFMPPSLLTSQFETLEPLEPDEHGLVIEVDQSIDAIVDEFVRRNSELS